MDDVCVVCGQPVVRVTVRDDQAVIETEPGPKMHLSCALEVRGQEILAQMAREVDGGAVASGS